MNYRVLGIATQLMVMVIIISVIMLFVGIGVLTIIHICIDRRRRIRRRTSRGGFGIMSSNVGRGSFGSTSMSRDDIEKLPYFDFKAREKGSSPVDCAVCLENFNVGDKCRSLPICDHSFHAECVDSWLLRTALCPICRSRADSWRGGSIGDKESSRFSGSLIEFRDGQTAESGHLMTEDTAIELGDDGQTENGHLMGEGTAIELGDGGQTAENARLMSDGTASELRDGSQTTETRHSMGEVTSMELRDADQTAENGHLMGVSTSIELRDGGQTAENGHMSEIAGIDLRESQAIEIGTHLGDSDIEPREHKTTLGGA